MASLIVTRPSGQENSLCEQLKALGFIVHHIPLLNISALPFELPTSDFEHVVFISPNACNILCTHTTKSQWQTLMQKKLFAIGPSTRECLMSHGASTVICPEKSNSESLIEMHDFHHMQQQSLLLVCGEGGRELIERTLSLRGVQIHRLEVYKREPLSRTAFEHYKDAIALTHTLWLLTSEESIRTLAQLLTKTPINAIVSSERLKTIAEEFDIHVKAVSYDATTPALLECVKNLFYKH